MSLLRKTVRKSSSNVGVAHGLWGESQAASFLRRQGYVIIERNSRPCSRDERLEVDVVAYDKEAESVVFVEVKQHASRSLRQTRLRSVSRAKMDNLLRACRAWLRKNRWQGAYRFDVVEVYGIPEGGAPEIDHIERVNLFASREKFVNWSD